MVSRVPGLYAGIDAGATKTHALLADAEGHVWGVGRSGPGNWEGVGLEGAYQVYAQALNQALGSADLRPADLAGLGCGLAGLDFPSDEGRLRPVVERLGVPGPLVLVNDTFAALRAGAQQGFGVVVIAGTGTTVAGCNRQGERFRTFGEGPALGDFGGAEDIVLWALRAVAQAHTGCGRPTALTHKFLQYYGVQEPLDFFEGICRGRLEWPPAALAPLVFEVATAGDAVAQEVIRYAGHELAANVVAIVRRLGLAGEPFELVLAGGVFRSQNPILLSTLLEAVRACAPYVQPVLLETAPVVGAAMLAMDAARVALDAQARQRLGREARERLAAVDSENSSR